MDIGIRRRVTTQRGVNIARHIRGPALERAVVLSIADNGILISPYHPGERLPGGDAHIREFDQYNRLYLPQYLMASVGISRDLLVIKNEDGTLTLKAAVACMGCGCIDNLHKVFKDKYICPDCEHRVRGFLAEHEPSKKE